MSADALFPGQSLASLQLARFCARHDEWCQDEGQRRHADSPLEHEAPVPGTGPRHEMQQRDHGQGEPEDDRVVHRRQRLDPQQRERGDQVPRALRLEEAQQPQERQWAGNASCIWNSR